MSVLFVPPCPTDCIGTAKDWTFSICAPTYHWGEVSQLYIANGDYAGFTTETSDGAVIEADWLAAIAAKDIEVLTVLGDLPIAEKTEVASSGDRIAVGFRTFTLNFEVDETNDANYTAMLLTQCGNKFTVWFESSDGLIFGGLDGIEMTLEMNYMIPRSRLELQKIMGTGTWKSLQAPFRATDEWL